MDNYSHPSQWKYKSEEEEGFHSVISPDNSACLITWIYRLNLAKGNSYTLGDKNLELNALIFKGSIKVTHNSEVISLKKLDSFYLPADDFVEIIAVEDCSIYIGGSISGGKGKYFTRIFDLSLPLGDIHQIHGIPPYRREVFMTVAEQDEGSRLICGITMGDPGLWTSWPPHQHSRDLEEVYCYFDIPKPASAFHFSSRKAGQFEFIHPVSTGDCVIIPEGYHPTCGMPGVRSCYFWVMAAHSGESRRYDLAVSDPYLK